MKKHDDPYQFIVDHFTNADFIDAAVGLGEVSTSFPKKAYSLVCFTTPESDRHVVSVLIPTDYFRSLADDNVVWLFEGSKKKMMDFLVQTMENRETDIRYTSFKRMK